MGYAVQTLQGLANQDQSKDEVYPYIFRTIANIFLRNHSLNQKSPLNNKFNSIQEPLLLDILNINKKRKKMHDYSKEEEDEFSRCCFLLSGSNMSNTVLEEEEEEEVCVDKNKNLDLDKLFQCKGCKKNFNSHQALGGHRASHKKVKGCFASSHNIEEDDNYKNIISFSEEEDEILENREFSSDILSESNDLNGIHHYKGKMKMKVHECSICHRVFASGQALGGHKRCHWLMTSGSISNIDVHSNVPSNPLPNFNFHADFNRPLFNYNVESKRAAFSQETEENDEQKRLHIYNDDYLDDDDEDEDEDKESIITYEQNCKINKDENDGIKDMKMEGVCASWLQVGISTSETNIDSTGSIA